MSSLAFFVQGQCNCKKCREQRQKTMSAKMLSKIRNKLSFLPANFDPEQGFNGLTIIDGKDLDAKINEVLEFNKAERLKLINAGVTKMWRRFCTECGKIHRRDPSTKTMVKGRVRYVCKECAEKHYYHCEKCKKFEKKGIETTVEKKTYCSDCAQLLFTHCRNCHSLNWKRNLINMDEYASFGSGVFLCQNCFDEYTAECVSCGRRDWTQNLRSMRNGGRICQACREMNQPIHSWRYKPSPVFHINKERERYHKQGLYFGIELEVELFGDGDYSNREYVGELVLKHMGPKYTYNKHDGSLLSNGERGFEIVSYPLSWQRYRDDRKKWDSLFAFLHSMNVHSYKSGRCAMHVHMSKPAFTTHQTYKFVDFMYNPKHTPFVIFLSDRGKYNEWFQTYASLDGYHNCKKNAKYKRGIHHSAVDLSPPTTNEVRIFRGTLTPSLFHKNMEFCKALYEFTRDVSRKDNTVYNFVKYIYRRQNRSIYRNLIKFIMSDAKIIKTYNLGGIF